MQKSLKTFVFRDFLYLYRLLGPAYGNPLLLPGISREWVQCPLAAFLHDSALVKHINGITEPAAGHGLIDTAPYIWIFLFHMYQFTTYFARNIKSARNVKIRAPNRYRESMISVANIHGSLHYICSSMIWHSHETRNGQWYIASCQSKWNTVFRSTETGLLSGLVSMMSAM